MTWEMFSYVTEWQIRTELGGTKLVRLTFDTLSYFQQNFGQWHWWAALGMKLQTSMSEQIQMQT